jgi:hypothetical protein
MVKIEYEVDNELHCINLYFNNEMVARYTLFINDDDSKISVSKYESHLQSV